MNTISHQPTDIEHTFLSNEIKLLQTLLIIHKDKPRFMDAEYDKLVEKIFSINAD
jgi:hypothetical protein